MKKANYELFNIDTQSKCFKIIDNLDDFKKAGVWALFGKPKSGKNKRWFCLQVGETKNIAREIAIDKKFIEGKMVCNRKKFYVNQFKQRIFPYPEYSSIQKELYKHINDNYNNLVFTCVSLEEDKQTRKDIESYFAKKTCAIYWRNGHPYTDGNLLNLNEVFNNSDKEISFNEPDKVKNKTEIYEFLNHFLSL